LRLERELKRHFWLLGVFNVNLANNMLSCTRPEVRLAPDQRQHILCIVCCEKMHSGLLRRRQYSHILYCTETRYLLVLTTKVIHFCASCCCCSDSKLELIIVLVYRVYLL